MAEPVPRPTRGQLVLLGALSAFGPLSMDMYLPGLPSLTRALHGSASAGQLTLTGCMVGIAVGQLIAGPVSDSLGRRRPLLAGLVGYTIASAACAFAPTMSVLIVLRLLQGLAGGVGIVIARAVVRDLFSGAAAARMFALLMMVTGVAPVFAPLVGGQVLALTSWRGVFILLAAIGVPLLLATLRGLPETLAPQRRHGGGLGATLRTFRRLATDRSFIPYALSFSLSFAAMFAYIAGSSFVLEDVYGTSPQVFSIVFAVNSAGLIVTSQLTARMVGRVGPVPLLSAGLVAVGLSAAATLVIAVTHAGLGPLLVALFLLVAGNGVVLPSGTAIALADQPQTAGSASALLGLGQFGAGAAIAPLVGLAGSRDPLPMAVVIAVCGVSAFAVNGLFAPRRARPPRPPSAQPRTGSGQPHVRRS